MVGDHQQASWENALTHHPDRYGPEPSAPARRATTLFQTEHAREIVELGSGQGRDTLGFAADGLSVVALDSAESGLSAIAAKARAKGLDSRITIQQHDVREPLPFADEAFDGVYSHMLYCMGPSATASYSRSTTRSDASCAPVA